MRDTLQPDSLRMDTLAASGKKKQPLDAPVTYEANDSIVFTQGGYAHLYGQGKVNYQQIELAADVITMNMDSSTVYAHGVEDSLGVKKGTPVFKDGETPYETNTIRYNFKSKKGIISNVVSQQGEGYVTGNNAKKGANDELYMKSGRYTTCDHHEHPHFYMQMTYAKVRPKKNVVTGPAYLVVEDVPLPLAVPFFFFPFSSSYSSGFLMPTYMDDSSRGFGLTDGGYYFAISDKMDLKLRADIFTKGSWALNAESNYIKRYKYSGLFQASYQVTKTGDTEGLDTELHLTINGGVINIDAANDGINTNEDNVSVTTINGGTLNIDAGLGSEGDGIDSNGWLVINGGSVFASACAAGGDSGIDASLEIVLNGGTVVALGNMFDAISSDSEQNYLTLTLSEPVRSGDEVELTDADGSALFDFTAPKTASMILLSGAEIEDGEEYTLTVNGTEREYSAEGMMGAPGGMGDTGGMGEAQPDMGQAPDDMSRGRMDIPEGLEDWLSAATDVPDEIRTWLESLIEMQANTPPDDPQ